MKDGIGRRDVLRGASLLGGGLLLNAALPAWAHSGAHGLTADMPMLSGTDIKLAVGHSRFAVGGRSGHAITVNGTLPAPLIRLREGQQVRLSVTNGLDEDTSIHWHGLILPFQMDGVPGVSFPGIRPGETFHYEFPVRQAGTYWYHSHSGLQEQMGHYGPIVIDPAGADPVAYDREHVIVLSDWSFLHPHEIFRKMKAQGGYFNWQKQALGDGGAMSAADRAMWGRMRMDPTDIADVTGATYTYLVNGHGPAENWTGLFRPGERVRLRIVNASAMTIFNVRIPGLAMAVVASDGQNVRPVTVDELQITVAETYDVIVTPTEDRAFTLVAESVDRSGMARATLAPRLGMQAPVPPLRPRPTLTMKDMGMDHGAMGHDGMDHGGMDQGGALPMKMPMKMRDKSKAPPGLKVGPGVDSIAAMPVDRTGDPGLGLEDAGHKVLTYRDLVSLAPNADTRPPARRVELHLTGNMERFMWSFDGETYSEVTEPIRFARDERVRVDLVNHSMMAHPIHLHGHFFEVVNGHTGNHPVKHTVNVLPGGKVSFDLTADAPGDWAFHCHLLYHMHAGMFRVVSIRPLDGEAA
ncbi:copper resistance system multicopper oxidase [Sphingomonas fennica]|uniref:Copper resistance system multicopper oxidase n=1 Tax=Edaphosphingomonas fennica TaxID=114404 RepID=A0A2T4I545_9SPHN|nr:copper resistance system multicopper oxidase [Sphingomonas fennica]PTD25007.1 copper resistance system multicopper oxidase [Sphingomonas fennica]